MAASNRVSALAERVRNSLFVVPTTMVLAGAVLGQVGVSLDAAVGSDPSALPFGLTSTVASARAVLSTIAGATITVAGIAFSVAILTIQLASSQYSPRVVGGLFRDPFNKRVIGIVAGTFAYCLVVLRAVRAAVDKHGTVFVPSISVTVGLVLGIVAILATIAFINHNAHTMDISEILAKVTRDTVESSERPWTDTSLAPADPELSAQLPAGPSATVRFTTTGWVQFVDAARLIDAFPPGSTVRLETAVGRYAVCGSPACTVWPPPPDPETATRAAAAAITTGDSRTLRQDPAFGVRQLVDVGLKALSPGVNDPTTAQDAIWHLAGALHHLLDRKPPARDLRDGSRRLLLTHVMGPTELVDLGYRELRVAAAPQPTVCVALVESLGELARSLGEVTPELHELLVIQARGIVTACREHGAALDDLTWLDAALVAAFPPAATGAPVTT